MLCYVMLCYVMLCYVMLCYVMLCYVMLCYVMLCCSHCSYSYIEYITQQMHSEHTVKCKYSGSDISSSFVLVMAGFFYFILCVGRICGFFNWYVLAGLWECNISAVQLVGTLCYIVLHCATLCYIVLHCATLCYIVLHCATLCYTVLHCATLCYTVLHCATLCYNVLHCATLCYIVLHCATLCYIVLQARRSRVVIGISYWHNPSGRTMDLVLTQPLTEMSTKNISWG